MMRFGLSTVAIPMGLRFSLTTGIDAILRIVSRHNVGLNPQRAQGFKARHAGNQFTILGIVRQIVISESDLVLEFPFIELFDVVAEGAPELS
jgi:hypothetical protein